RKDRGRGGVEPPLRHADERPLATRQLPGFPTLSGPRHAGAVPARRRAVDRDTLEALPRLSAQELTDVLRRHAGDVCLADTDRAVARELVRRARRAEGLARRVDELERELARLHRERLP